MGTAAGSISSKKSCTVLLLTHDVGKLQDAVIRCKDGKTAGRTKGVRHTCPEPLKGRGETRYFTPKGTQGKGGVGKKSKAEGLSAGDSTGSDRSARPEV